MTVKTKRITIRVAAGVAALALATLVVLWVSPGSGPRAAEAADGKAPAESTTQEAKAPIPVRVAMVERGEIASYISGTANLVAENDVRVLAEAEGRVTRLEVEEGDRVAAGAVLAVLDRADAEIAERKARLRASNADLAFERAARTLDQGLISNEEFDRLRMEHEVAEQEVAEAEWQLEKTVIRAPFSGRVTERLITVGQHVRPGDILFGLADFDPLVARIFLPESDVLDLETGREVRITLAADPTVRFAGSHPADQPGGRHRDRHCQGDGRGDRTAARGPTRRLRHRRHRPRAARGRGAGAPGGGDPRAALGPRLRGRGRPSRQACGDPRTRGGHDGRSPRGYRARRADHRRRPGRAQGRRRDQDSVATASRRLPVAHGFGSSGAESGFSGGSMRIVEFSLRRRVTVSMCAVAVVLFGLVAFTRLPINLLPDLSLPEPHGRDRCSRAPRRRRSSRW